MTRADREWELLQNRWVSGEVLTAEEEQQRLLLAERDPIAQRELEVFAELRSHLAHTKPPPREFVERVLEQRLAHPHLRVVSDTETLAPVRNWRARRWLAAVAMAGLAALAAVAGVKLWPAESESPLTARSHGGAATAARAELVMTAGNAFVRGDSTVVGSAPLSSGQHLVTGEGRACLTIDPGIFVCIGSNSELVVDSLKASDLRVRVERGTATAALSRRDAEQSFSLTVGAVVATALGTVFSVERDADRQRIDITVMEGTVRVTSNAHEQTVGAHSRLRVLPGSHAGSQYSIGRAEEARLWALVAERELWAQQELGVLDIKGEAGHTAHVDGEGPLSLPLRVFVPVGLRRVTLSSAESTRTLGVDVVAGGIRDISAMVPDPAESKPAATKPVPSATSLLSNARRKLALGDSQGALALYRKLRDAHPASPEARTVLITMGKLELDLSQPSRALARFESYLRGGGPLAPEASAGKVRALRALGREVEERAAIREYLARYPNGFEAPMLRKRLASLTSP